MILPSLRLKSNWQRIAARSLSFHCHAAAVLASAAIAGGLMLWPAMQEHIPLGWFCAGAMVLSLAGGALRLVDQGIE